MMNFFPYSAGISRRFPLPLQLLTFLPLLFYDGCHLLGGENFGVFFFRRLIIYEFALVLSSFFAGRRISVFFCWCLFSSNRQIPSHMRRAPSGLGEIGLSFAFLFFSPPPTGGRVRLFFFLKRDHKGNFFRRRVESLAPSPPFP